MSNRDGMDCEAAIAFACHRFEQLHPKAFCPEWLPRCTMIGYHFDCDKNYIVCFSVTPIATNNGIRYFEVSIDSSTGETKVLLDKELPGFIGTELQGFAIAE